MALSSWKALGCGAVTLLALGLGACAHDPVVPVQVSTLKYSGMSCPALTTKVAEMDQSLAVLHDRQRTIATNDLLKSIFFLHARGTIVGPDLGPTVSLQEGERAAASQVMQARC